MSLSDDIEEGVKVSAFLFIVGPHLLIGWLLTRNIAGMLVLAVFTFFGAVHIWRAWWEFLDRWRREREGAKGLRARWRALRAALPPEPYRYPGRA